MLLHHVAANGIEVERQLQTPPNAVEITGGARVDGLGDDGEPLWTAIAFGYTEAAEALERCGARVDNIVFTAALGRLADVRGYFDADGKLAHPPARSAERLGDYGPPLEPGRLVDHALIYAALHGRRDVVAFLVGKEPDLTFTEPLFHSTAAGAAKWAGSDEIVALLS
jgi:hypothetical protein